MKLFLVLLSLLLPLIMFFLQRIQVKFRFIFNIGAIITAIIFGNIAALSIYEIIKDNTVFMTNIHSIFLNPFFLLTGGYLGAYFIYRLILLAINDE